MRKVTILNFFLVLTIVFMSTTNVFATRETYEGYWPGNRSPITVNLRNCPDFNMSFWDIREGIIAWNGITIRVHFGSVQLVSSLLKEGIGVFSSQDQPIYCSITKQWVPPIFGQTRLYRKVWWGYSEIVPPHSNYEYAYARIEIVSFWFSEDAYTYGFQGSGLPLDDPDLGKKIVCHEIGHSLGLGHPTSVDTSVYAVMHQDWWGYWSPQHHDRTNILSKYGSDWD